MHVINQMGIPEKLASKRNNNVFKSPNPTYKSINNYTIRDLKSYLNGT